MKYQTASASAGSPQYCAITGHINTYIGFEILLPVSTWRQRYLQVGCGGLCGSISIAPPQTTGYKPLADGGFVLAAEDDGHSGNSPSWCCSRPTTGTGMPTTPLATWAESAKLCSSPRRGSESSTPP